MDSPGFFNTYVVLLAIAGIVMLAVALVPMVRQSTTSRVIGGLIGAAFLGYAFYLKFVFDGGTYEVFFYVFIIPFVYIARVVRSYAQRNRARQAATMPPGYQPFGQAPVQQPVQQPAQQPGQQPDQQTPYAQGPDRGPSA